MVSSDQVSTVQSWLESNNIGHSVMVDNVQDLVTPDMHRTKHVSSDR